MPSRQNHANNGARSEMERQVCSASWGYASTIPCQCDRRKKGSGCGGELSRHDLRRRDDTPAPLHDLGFFFVPLSSSFASDLLCFQREEEEEDGPRKELDVSSVPWADLEDTYMCHLLGCDTKVGVDEMAEPRRRGGGFEKS